jgi:S-disulfanyl-L-cysteine oxidoreductase SoxD
VTRACAAALLLWVAALSTASARQAEPTRMRSTNDGIYTEAQAERGRVLFTDVCSICHNDPLWRPGWQGKPLGEVYTKILKYMPDDNPGTLSSAEVVAALAYIMRSNGVAAGTEPLPDDVTVLDRITVVEPPK